MCDPLAYWVDINDGQEYVDLSCGRAVLAALHDMLPECPHEYDGPADADYNSDRELRYREV